MGIAAMGFLGQQNFLVGEYNGEYVSLYLCPNPYNIIASRVNPSVSMDLG